ncbi:MAG: MarR family transcriptional regulator [Leptospiraceae bacterium]|nr:MarR family transcriptional regulator [Leptospiraceae bacterium]
MRKESKLPVAFKNPKNEAVASLYWTALLFKKVSKNFLFPFLSSDAQFNILLLLNDNNSKMTQKDLSEKLIVDKSNITGMIDRMEKINLLKRTPHSADNRSYIIQLTNKGKNLANKLEKLYLKKINTALNGLSNDEIEKYININEKIRNGLLSL